MMRVVRTTACLCLMLAAACGPKPRPITMRDLTQNDVGVCYKNASIGNPNLHGDGVMIMYVDADGAIPAAWFHDAGKLDSPMFFRCLTSIAVESKHETGPVDHIFGWTVSCEENGCQMKPLNTLPPAPFEESVAQATLTFSDWADSTDKGWAYYYTHKYSDAQATFQAVVDAHPDDVRAQRGLAQSLIENGGDVKKAREAADKAVSMKKGAASLESLVRVCLKAGDDDCAVRSFVDATKSDDVKFRTLDLAVLNEPAKAANDRLQAADKAREEEAAKARAEAEAKAAKADPLGCYKMTGAEQAKCYVKKCFEAGAQAYAADLTKMSGASYAAGEITSAAGIGSATIVTIAIRGAEPKGKHKGKAKAGDNKDASWTVILGDNIDMKPYKENLSAYNIAKDHNACK